MLVLSRKTNQAVQIGNDVVITIFQIKGKSVRLGIEAPQETEIRRSDLQPLVGRRSRSGRRKDADCPATQPTRG